MISMCRGRVLSDQYNILTTLGKIFIIVETWEREEEREVVRARSAQDNPKIMYCTANPVFGLRFPQAQHKQRSLEDG